ncbi:MAG TPA: VOC family protein [Chitinophagaceae bacterium]|nr:VOC family protein [Chitinophagaceae bacterium]
MERVIGLGGPFIKAVNPKELAAWYEKHLGVPFNGGTYAMWNTPEPGAAGCTIFSLFPEQADYFQPSSKTTMINFIVKDLFGLIATLREEGVNVVGEPIAESYGKFGWILDPEGNKIELWEPPVS